MFTMLAIVLSASTSLCAQTQLHNHDFVVYDYTNYDHTNPGINNPLTFEHDPLTFDQVHGVIIIRIQLGNYTYDANLDNQFFHKADVFEVNHYEEETYSSQSSDLWYFRARYFSDELGRFVSRDPLSYVDGFGLYGAYFAAGFGLDATGTTAMNAKECIKRCPKVKSSKDSARKSARSPTMVPSPKCMRECNELCGGYNKYHDDDKANDPCVPGGRLKASARLDRNTGGIELDWKITGIDKKCCKKVGLLQYFKLKRSGYVGSDVKKWRLDTGDFSSSDVSEFSAYYNLTSRVMKDGVSAGVLGDKPSIWGHFDFVVVFVCAEGPAKGYVFGTHEWSIDVGYWNGFSNLKHKKGKKVSGYNK